MQLKNKEVHCDKPEWEDLARLLAFRLEEHKTLEFDGVYEAALFEDGDTQTLGPYARFLSRKTFPNGRRASSLVPFNEDALRQAPETATHIANAAWMGMENLYKDRPSGDIR